MERAFLFVRGNPEEFFPFATVLTHCTEFPIAGKMHGPFSALYSRKNQGFNMPSENEVRFVKAVGGMLEEGKMVKIKTYLKFIWEWTG